MTTFAKRLLAANTLEATPTALRQLKAHGLKKLIDDAVKRFRLDSTWKAPRTNDTEDLLDHLSELCNEHGLEVDDKGKIVKA